MINEPENIWAPYANAAHRALGAFFIRTMITKHNCALNYGQLIASIRRLNTTMSLAQCQAIIQQAFNIVDGNDPNFGIDLAGELG